VEWEKTTASHHDKNVAFLLIDSIRDYCYVMMDAAYDSSDIYEYIFENSKCSPVIDTNRRRGIVDSKLSHSRREEASRYSLRWKIERTFAILEEILVCKFLWYAKHRNYDVTIGMKIVAYNIIILMNQIYQSPKSR
jgi:IS4 transposase